jgi:hypothetical protein
MLKKLTPLLGLLLTGCGASGVCISEGGNVDECKEDWSSDECAEWDDLEVNGASWSFSGGTCEDHGFSEQCSDGSWVASSDDC